MFCYRRYEQPGGYRPAPVDLSQVLLSSAHQEVVNLLAENDHNVWARERIAHGWTYGTHQVRVRARSFTAIRQLVRYHDGTFPLHALYLALKSDLYLF